MNKRRLLLVAAAIVLIANASALAHAWRNRLGPVETEITLTERELALNYNFNKEDTGMALHLVWVNVQETAATWDTPAPMFDTKTLRELGFDTSIAASDTRAFEFYQRQLPRQAFLALEYEGPAWRRQLEYMEREAQEHPDLRSLNRTQTSSHLVAIDIDTNASSLRARHPDRRSVLILPVTIDIQIRSGRPAMKDKPAGPAFITAFIQGQPVSIHVPLPFSDPLRRLRASRRDAAYRVHLGCGASLEPWITGVEFTPPMIP